MAHTDGTCPTCVDHSPRGVPGTNTSFSSARALRLITSDRPRGNFVPMAHVPTRSLTKSQPRSLLSMRKLNNASSRSRLSFTVYPVPLASLKLNGHVRNLTDEQIRVHTSLRRTLRRWRDAPTGSGYARICSARPQPIDDRRLCGGGRSDHRCQFHQRADPGPQSIRCSARIRRQEGGVMRARLRLIAALAIAFEIPLTLMALAYAITWLVMR